jgi:hypothetical protein
VKLWAFTLKMEAEYPSETPVYYHITSRRHIPEDHDLDLKFVKYFNMILKKLVIL